MLLPSRIRRERLECEFPRYPIYLGFPPAFLAGLHRDPRFTDPMGGIVEFPSSTQALAKYDKYSGENIVAPVERKAVIPVLIM